MDGNQGEICRIAVLISARGSNMIALADAIRAGLIPGATISLVISDQPGAIGLSAAHERGLHTIVIERGGRTREEHEREIVATLRDHDIALVCLAGYMRLLSRYFIEAFRNRILNIHPSLLPAFPGLNAQKQALEQSVKWTGCTVHFVDETLDGGPIILQKVVPVFEGDTEETLAARILVEEHRLYPEAVALVLRDHCELFGQRVL